MKRATAVVLVFLLPVFLGCNLMRKPTAAPSRDPAVNEFVQAAMSHPLEFTLGGETAASAWKRAEGFIFGYSPMNVSIFTDTLIQTYEPRGKGLYSYKVTRAEQEKGWLFTVACVPNDPKLKARAERNAHLLAYYMGTGRLTYPEAIYR